MLNSTFNFSPQNEKSCSRFAPPFCRCTGESRRYAKFQLLVCQLRLGLSARSLIAGLLLSQLKNLSNRCGKSTEKLKRETPFSQQELNQEPSLHFELKRAGRRSLLWPLQEASWKMENRNLRLPGGRGRRPLADLTVQSNNRQNSHQDHAALPNKQASF